MTSKLNNLIKKIDQLNEYEPRRGLPDSIFYFIGRNTPYINVDLLIKDQDGSILLTWRDNAHDGKGWHIPGGIIRYKEKIEKRIIQVAKTELGVGAISQSIFLELNEIIEENKKERGHFISLLYECKLDNKNYENLLKRIAGDKEIKFFKKLPSNILKYHKIYEEYFT